MKGPKSKRVLWIGLAVCVAVMAVACGQGKATAPLSGPELKVEDVITALEDRDLETLYAMIDPQGVEYLHQTQQMDPNQLKAALGQELMAFDSIEYSGVKMKTEMSSDGHKATVTLVGGQSTTVKAGQTTVEDYETAVDPEQYYLILRDGTWYLDIVQMTQTQ
jgi:hypothetical protein